MSISNKSRGGLLVALMAAALLACFVAPARAWAAEANSLDEVYVSNKGSDETGEGTQTSPVATLAKAVELAASGTEADPTEIIVMTDLTMTKPARFWNKHISITGVGDSAVTVSRGVFSGEAGDPARLGYNSAMVEVNGATDKGVVSTLTLSNIIFDDCSTQAGKYFIQAASRGTGTTDFGDLNSENGTAIDNSNIVQDAMIATYNGTGKITLGDGAVLKNFGGMSAVRLSGGELVMKSGSKIVDDAETARTKGEKIPGADSGLYGPAGAVWMQGGTIVMEQGSEMADINGRALYNEAGSATINGTLSGIKPNSAMWQGNSGVVMHMRMSAKATFGPTAVVDGKGVTLSGNAIGVLGGCELTMDEGSLLANYSKGTALDIGGMAYLNGEITGLTGGGHAIVSQNWDTEGIHYIQIGSTGYIHDNVCNYGTIYIQGSSGVIDIYGKINDNVSTDRGGALALANNGTHVEANMYEGAEICGNVSTQTGGGVLVSCGTFTMYGGTISGNISGANVSEEEDQVGGGVYVRRGGQFIMNGGVISDNYSGSFGGNIAVVTDDYNAVEGTTYGPAYVQLNGGTISGGMMNANISQAEDGSYVANGGQTNDIAVTGSYGKMRNYLSISDAFEVANPDVLLSKYGFYIANPAKDVKLGNASTTCETAVTSAFAPQYLDVVVGSFWYYSDSAAQDFSLTVPENDTYNPDKQLVAAYIATGEDGNPAPGATPALIPAEIGDDGRISLTVPGGGDGYAVVLLQENENSRGIVSLAPADLTAYMGGDGGYENVVGPEGESESTLPRPVFRVISAPAGVDVTDFVFTNKITAGGQVVSTNSWKLVPVDTVDSSGQYYRFEGTTDTTPAVRFQFTDSDGNVTVDGDFETSAEQELYKQYRISVYSGAEDGQTSAVTVTYEEDPYTPAIGFGTLTVRATADEDPTSPVLASKPAELAAGTAAAVVSGDTVYTLGATGIVLSEDNNEGFAPSLLFDNIIDEEGVDRTAALLGRIDGATKENSQAKYLDLVDANNGNAWIKSSKGVTVYWVLPEGVSDDAEISLWHFRGLHRDADGSGFDINDVAAVSPEEVEFTRDGSTIVFDVEEGGFSPFVLTWTDAPDEPDVPTPPATSYEITATAGEGGTISPSGTVTVTAGGSRSFSITPDGGYLVQSVVVDGVNVGATDSYTFTNVREDHTISVTFIRGNAPADPDDTGVSDWFDTKSHDVFLHGYDNGLFGPENNMTRGEAAAMFYNMLLDKSEGDAEYAFEDVSEGRFYTKPIRVLATRSLLFGTSETTFEPERPITRAEFTAIAMRFSNSDRTGEGLENIFTDVHEDDWFYGVVVSSTQFGWIYGYNDGTGRFGPNDTITRAQATSIANRMLGRMADGVWIAAHLDELKLFPDVPEDHFAFRAIAEATNAHDYVKHGIYESWTGVR